MIANKQVTTTEGLHSLDASVTLTEDTLVMPTGTLVRKFKRQCIACRQYFSKTELLKITKPSQISTTLHNLNVSPVAPVPVQKSRFSNRSSVVLNPDTKSFGRSVYCCFSLRCRQKITEKQGKFLKQRLKLSTALPTNQWELLLASLQNNPLPCEPLLF